MQKKSRKPVISNTNSSKRRMDKPDSCSDAQLSLLDTLNEIESLSNDYPLVEAKEAAQFCHVLRSNDDVEGLVEQHKLFAFTFGHPKSLKVPVFQFDPVRKGTWEPIPRLCELFGELNDWAVFHWFTTFNEDLGMTPATALKEASRHGELLELAGLYVNESQCKHLSFSIDGNDNEKKHTTLSKYENL